MKGKITNDLYGGGSSISINGIEHLRDPDKTYFVIKQPTEGDFVFNTNTTGTNNFTIEWGDGASDTVTTTNATLTHTYEKAGMYLLTVSGTFSGFIQNADNRTKIIEAYGGSNYTSIGSKAFQSCLNLTTAVFPRVTNISSQPFQNCTSLTTAVFPSITSIGNYVFDGCTKLTTAVFPNATSIGNYAFHGCTGLTTAVFPNATSIGTSTFRGCTSLTIAVFPNVTSISSDAFRGCTGLKELTIDNVITSGSGTRFFNVVLDKLTISGNVTDTDINRITQMFINNGGTFSEGTSIVNGLQVQKIPTLPNDAVRKVELDTKISDAPADGKQYARQNESWAEITGGTSSKTAQNLNITNTTSIPSIPTEIGNLGFDYGLILTVDNPIDLVDGFVQGKLMEDDTPGEYLFSGIYSNTYRPSIFNCISCKDDGYNNELLVRLNSFGIELFSKIDLSSENFTTFTLITDSN